MSKADVSISRQSTGMQWIAAGVIAERASLASAVQQIMAAGASLADLCLVATPQAAHRLATAPDGQDVDVLRALLRVAVETTLPGYDFAILASASCVANPVLLLEILNKAHAHIVDGAIMLGVSVKSPSDLARVGRILLRHSSHRVHMLERTLAPLGLTTA